MNPIPINTILSPGCLYFSDLKLQDLPKTHFYLNSWTTGDRWMKFCAELLWLSVQNLILNQCISVAWRTEETTVLFFFKRLVTRYYLKLNNTEVGDGKEGFLERLIVARIREREEIPLKELLHKIFDQLLGRDETFVNPGKEVVAILIKKHPNDFLTYKYKQSFLSGHKMTVYHKAPPAARQLLDTIQASISAELNRNNEFLEFNSALRRGIDREFFKRHDTD